jgi:hypothetical protein
MICSLDWPAEDAAYQISMNYKVVGGKRYISFDVEKIGYVVARRVLFPTTLAPHASAGEQSPLMSKHSIEQETASQQTLAATFHWEIASQSALATTLF